MNQSAINRGQRTAPYQTHQFDDPEDAHDVYLRTTSGDSAVFENVSQNLMTRLSQQFDILDKSASTQRIKL